MTVTIALGSFVGFVASILGYFVADLSVLTALAVYIGTPIVCVMLFAAIRMMRPCDASEQRLLPAE